AELILTGDAARFANAELRRRIDNVGVAEAWRFALEEVEERRGLLAAFDLARRQLIGLGAVERTAVRPLHLRDVDAPFDRISLRPHHGAHAREFHATSSGRIHQLRNALPGIARGRGIDAIHAEHHGRIERAARAVAELERRASPGREIAITRAVD